MLILENCSFWHIQRSRLGLLLFLIYIKELPNFLISLCKIFADDTHIFSEVFDKDNSQGDLNNDLSIMSKWAFQWKMKFNLEPNKVVKFLLLLF